MIAHAPANARAIPEKAGATTIATEVPIQNSGWHRLATARMGFDPEPSGSMKMGRSGWHPQQEGK
jgi:hypothetical protein